MKDIPKYVALLRGINVGGHKKVPMANLREAMVEMGYSNVQTLLNSGNVVFEGNQEAPEKIEERIALQLERYFGFSIPVLVRKANEIKDLVDSDPFEKIEIAKDIRLYVTFLKKVPSGIPATPWQSDDGSFRILKIEDRSVCSVLNVSLTKTTDSMIILEKFFGKDITTRNWNTILKIYAKL